MVLIFGLVCFILILAQINAENFNFSNRYIIMNQKHVIENFCSLFETYFLQFLNYKCHVFLIN